MRTVLLTATALVALSSLAVAQNQLPPTTVTSPKIKPMSTSSYVPVTGNGNLDANLNPNASIDPTMPKVRARDWNAPGVANLHYMTERQFAEFQRIHPTAVMPNRCYIGQDPDINI